MIPQFVLGTVQIGKPYGVANRTGMPASAAATELLEEAWRLGVRVVDTARDYGESESRIGAWCHAHGRHPRVITKIPKCSERETASEHIRRCLEASASALRPALVDTALLHHEGDLSLPGVAETLIALRDSGQIGKIGVSVYAPEAAIAAVERGVVDVVQAPMNLFDRRAETSGLAALCAERGVELHARSVFLQGLFFLEAGELPIDMQAAGAPLERAHKIASSMEMSLAELSVRIAGSTVGITHLVLGAERADQIKSLVDMVESDPPPGLDRNDIFAEVGAVDERVFNPSCWGRASVDAKPGS